MDIFLVSLTLDSTQMAVSKVSVLRNCRFKCVDKTPGLYRWWFKKEVAHGLIKNMSQWLTENDKFYMQNFDGEEYIALYFGISTNLRDRIRWHISDKHRPSSVSTRFLSTLRQTLSALLEKPMTESEDIINKFLDDNCILEWSYTETHEAARQVELNTLSPKSPYYYPLNVESNHTIHKDALKWLKQQRKEYRR